MFARSILLKVEDEENISNFSATNDSMNQNHCLLYILSSEYLTTLHVIHHKSFKQLDHSSALMPQPGTRHQALICWLMGTQIRMAVVNETTNARQCHDQSMLLGNPDDYSEPANVGSNATRADQRGKHMILCHFISTWVQLLVKRI